MAHRGWKRDGFTPAKKAAAIEALEKYGNVTDAARVAGVSDTTFYRHLTKDPEFQRLCDLARAKAARPLEALAWQRATEGTPETIIRDGKVVQIKVKPSDSMMRLMLQASNPEKYGRLSGSAASRAQIEKEVREQIEAERGPRRDVCDLIDEIAARLEEIEAEQAEEARLRAEGGEAPEAG